MRNAFHDRISRQDNNTFHIDWKDQTREKFSRIYKSETIITDILYCLVLVQLYSHITSGIKLLSRVNRYSATTTTNIEKKSWKLIYKNDTKFNNQRERKNKLQDT